MSTWIVLERPSLGLFAGHLEEARRALRAQGRPDLSDEDIAKALWAARALPAALDALCDTRAGAPLARLTIRGLRVHRIPDGGAPVEGALVAVAVHEVGSDRVEVRFVPPDSANGAEATREMSAAVIELHIQSESTRPPSDDDDGADVVLQRFRHGAAGQRGEPR